MVSIMWQIEVELDVVIYNLELVRTGWGTSKKGWALIKSRFIGPGNSTYSEPFNFSLTLTAQFH